AISSPPILRYLSNLARSHSAPIGFIFAEIGCAAHQCPRPDIDDFLRSSSMLIPSCIWITDGGCGGSLSPHTLAGPVIVLTGRGGIPACSLTQHVSYDVS
ncbi:hypothetical protein NEOLI_005472, partial [Neolecta irregularis DAH-3]